MDASHAVAYIRATAAVPALCAAILHVTKQTIRPTEAELSLMLMLVMLATFAFVRLHASLAMPELWTAAVFVYGNLLIMLWLIPANGVSSWLSVGGFGLALMLAAAAARAHARSRGPAPLRTQANSVEAATMTATDDARRVESDEWASRLQRRVAVLENDVRERDEMIGEMRLTCNGLISAVSDARDDIILLAECFQRHVPEHQWPAEVKPCLDRAFETEAHDGDVVGPSLEQPCEAREDVALDQEVYQTLGRTIPPTCARRRPVAGGDTT